MVGAVTPDGTLQVVPNEPEEQISPPLPKKPSAPIVSGRSCTKNAAPCATVQVQLVVVLTAGLCAQVNWMLVFEVRKYRTFPAALPVTVTAIVVVGIAKSAQMAPPVVRPATEQVVPDTESHG